MKRGTDWEDKIQMTLDDMSMLGMRHTIVKTEAPVKVIRHVKGAQCLVVFTAPGQCDFEGAWPLRGKDTRCVPVCIEAKETNQPRISITDGKAFKDSQVERLDATMKMVGIAGALVRFRPGGQTPECWGIPWRVRELLLQENVKSFKMHDLYNRGAMKFGNPLRPSAEEMRDFLNHCFFMAEVRS